MDEFEDIRPFRDDEVPGVVENLVNNREFLDFLCRYDSPRLSKLAPALVRFFARRRLVGMLGNLHSISDFQLIVKHYVSQLIDETMTSFSFSGIDQLDPKQPYVFISNHRDIAGDSMLVDYALHVSGFETVRIAVGDNLIQRQFATDLMRLNKSFFIKRSEEGARKVYAALSVSSRYIHKSLAEGQSVWIAQREGRAKDGLDLTDPAVIKMLALAQRKDPFGEVIESLHIVPVSLSYEFDPCDELKAKELLQRSQTGTYRKPEGEDLLSLARGLGGFKGRVALAFSQPIGACFDDADDVAEAIDRLIVGNLALFPCNFLALRELAERGEGDYAEVWRQVEAIGRSLADPVYAERRAACPEAVALDFMRMYANPIANKLRLGLPVSAINVQ